MQKSVQSEKVKDMLVTRTAIKTLKSESTVETVVSFVLKDTRDAMKLNDEVEISGFGKFFISKGKLKRFIERKIRNIEDIKLALERDTIPDYKKDGLRKSLEIQTQIVETLKPKLEAFK